MNEGIIIYFKISSALYKYIGEKFYHFKTHNFLKAN